MENELELHEKLELHEILTFKNICLTKSASMGALAQDDELKAILAQDTAQSKQAIQQLQQFFTENRREK